MVKFEPKIVNYTLTNSIGEEICLIPRSDATIKVSKSIDELKTIFTGEIIAKKRTGQHRAIKIESFKIIRKTVDPEKFKIGYNLTMDSKMVDLLTCNSKTYNYKHNSKIVYKIDFAFTKEGAKLQLRNKLAELEDKYAVNYSDKCELETLR